MTTQAQLGEGQPNQGEGQGEGNVDVETLRSQLSQLKEQLEAAQGKTARLEDESKTHKSKYLSIKEEKEREEKEKLEQQGKWRERLELEQNKNLELESNLNELKQEIVKDKAIAEISRLAKDVADPQDVANYSGFWEHVKVKTEGNRVLLENVEEALAEARKVKPHYFPKQGSARMIDGNPQGQPNPATTYEDEIRKCATQKELDAVRKKYGRALY